MAETQWGVGPSGHCKEGRLRKQMGCQSLRKINEAGLGANWRHVEPEPEYESGYSSRSQRQTGHEKKSEMDLCHWSDEVLYKFHILNIYSVLVLL